MKAVSPYLQKRAPATIQMADMILHNAAGAKFHILHGCIRPGCNHVFDELDFAEFCPNCNTARFDDETGEANETVFYFPLRDRLKALTRTVGYRQITTYEDRRKKHADYYTDVYDSQGRCLL